MNPRSTQTGRPRRRTDLIAQSGHCVRLAGEPVGVEIERDSDPSRVDHLWISVYAGDFGLMRITLNTCSPRSRDLGFDSRIRVGIFKSTWSELPLSGVVASERLDYATVETLHAIAFPEMSGTRSSCSSPKKLRARFSLKDGESFTFAAVPEYTKYTAAARALL